MRVLVTGAFGFLGRAVVSDLLDQGHEVVALSRAEQVDDRPGLTVVRADIGNRAALTAALAPLPVDGVCHLAARTSVRDSFADPVGYFDANIGGSTNLLHAVQADTTGRLRFVFVSTSAVYGSTAQGLLSEDIPTNPTSPYATAKATVEQLLTYSTRARQSLAAVSLRCFNIAGGANGHGDEDRTRIIPSALSVAAGLTRDVKVNGDGSAVREFTHVLDVATAVRLALVHARPGEHQVFNVGTGTGASVLDVVRTAERTTGRTIPVFHGPAAVEAHTVVADGRRIRETLGWTPERSSIGQIIEDAWAVTRRLIPDGVPVFTPRTAPDNLLTSWQLRERGLHVGGPAKGWLNLDDGPGMALYDVAEAVPR